MGIFPVRGEGGSYSCTDWPISHEVPYYEASLKRVVRKGKIFTTLTLDPLPPLGISIFLGRW